MIATLEGKVTEKDLDTVVIDVAGVGYGVQVTSEDLASVELDQTAKFFIYEHIRENTHDLFGFLQTATKRLFEQLLGVNGVGPKMALAVLSLGSVESVSSAIANSDAVFIQQASGVGKRVAERVVVDLKDKVGVAGVGAPAHASTKDDAVQGLVALGFTVQDAAQALAGIDEKLPTEERIKQALKGAK